jgi:hypothetical protein
MLAGPSLTGNSMHGPSLTADGTTGDVEYFFFFFFFYFNSAKAKRITTEKDVEYVSRA